MKLGVPAVRIAVTPDWSKPWAAFAAYCTVCSAIVAEAIRGHSRCTCTSHKPGSTYAPPRSITCAPADVLPPDGAMSAMRPFSIVTAIPGAMPGAAPPITCAFARTRVMDAPRSPVVEGPTTIAKPDPDEVPLALGLRPIAEAGPLVRDLAVVEELHLSRLEVEIDGHVLAAHDPVERVERRQARGVQWDAGQCLSVLDLKAREASAEPAHVQLEDRMLDDLHVIMRVLALPVEEERLIETRKEIGMA